MMRMTLLPSGEKRKSATSRWQCEAWWRLVPSAFIPHNWLLPDSEERKAILLPPSMNTAPASLLVEVVRQVERRVAMLSV